MTVINKKIAIKILDNRISSLVVRVRSTVPRAGESEGAESQTVALPWLFSCVEILPFFEI